MDPILIVKWKWLKRILAGSKTHEIRCRPCPAYKGKRLWLAASGTSRVFGSARVQDSIGPLSEVEWHTSRPFHCVEGPRLYKRTYAWVLENVTRCTPKRITRKPGAIGVQLGPGP